MSNDYEADIIMLVDDEGEEHEFEVIDEIDTDDGHFLALVSTKETDLADPDTYYIFETQEEDGEEQLLEVEDDALLDKLAEIFESRFQEEYFDDEEEEE